jgi:signal peptidase II
LGIQESQPEAAYPATSPFKALWQNYRFFWLAFFVVLIDQISKFWVKYSMNPYDEVKVFGDVFSINYIENKGAAFGLTVADIGEKLGWAISEDTAKLVLTLFSIFAIVVIVYMLRQVRTHGTALPLCLSLILGGAVGNIIDRVFYGVWFAGVNDYDGGLLHGRVVDMFYLDVYHGQLFGTEVNLLPVFNIADAAITIGILMILAFQRRFFRKVDEIPAAVPPAAPSSLATTEDAPEA